MDHRPNGITCSTKLSNHFLNVVLPIYVVSICKAWNFVFSISFIYFSLLPICNGECDEFFVKNFIIFFLSQSRTKLLAANHLIIWERTKYDTEQKSLKFLLKVMTLVSSANDIGSDTEFILRGRSFIYIMNNRGPRIDPWGTPCFIVPQLEREKKLSSIRWCYLNFLYSVSSIGPETFVGILLEFHRNIL